MPVTRHGLVEAVKQAGYGNVSERLVTDWVDLGLLDQPARTSRGKGNGAGALYLWPDTQRDLFLQLISFRREVKNVASLACLPVAAWLYWGDDYVPLRQVKVALLTYWQRAGKLRSYERVKKEAWVVIKAIVGDDGSRTTREQLHSQIVHGLDNQEFDTDAITTLVAALLESLPNKAFGPFRFGPDAVVDMIRQFAVAMTNYEHFTDGDFVEVRARQRQHVLEYLRRRPALASDPTFGGWFEDIDYSFLVNNACRDLMSGLGQKIIASDRGLSFAPLVLAPWTRPPAELMRPVT